MTELIQEKIKFTSNKLTYEELDMILFYALKHYDGMDRQEFLIDYVKDYNWRENTDIKCEVLK